MNSFDENIDDIGYLSDEQLEELIGSVEKSGMIKAPSYMKHELLSRVTDNKAAANTEIKNRQFRSYVFKVVLASAAAIAVLFMAPLNTKMPAVERTPYSTNFYDSSSELMKRIDDHSTQTMEKINEWSNMMIIKF